MAVTPPVCDFGASWYEFNLTGTDDLNYRLEDIAGTKGTVIMFICNHCPYVRSVLDRIVRDAAALQEIGIGVVAISANDPDKYPQDGPEQMKIVAKENRFTFPYLFDKSQEIASLYGAECTPDFFGYNADGELQYRGRLDSSGRNSANADTKRELYDAMVLIAETGKGPENQTPSIGCSIKWREG